MNSSHTSRLTAMTSLAVLTIGLLSGCSCDCKDSQENQGGAAVSAPASEQPSQASEQANVEPAQSETPAPPQEQQPAPAAVVPEGYQSVTAAKNRLTFAVPQGWVPVVADIFDGGEEGARAYLQGVSEQVGVDAEALLQQMQKLDLMVLAGAPDENGFSNNINVAAETAQAETLPSEEVMRQMTERFGAIPGAYRTLQTPLGEAAEMTYTQESEGPTAHGTFIIVPAADAGGFTAITVSAGTPEASAEYAKVIEESISLVAE